MSSRPTRRAVGRVASVSGAAAVMLLATGPVASAAPSGPLTISGTSNVPLYPGGTSTLDLQLHNTGSDFVTITGVTVRIAALTPQPGRTCSLADFTLRQLSSAINAPLAAGQTATLTQLGIPVAALPNISMTNTTLNQDGCKLAQFTLDYEATTGEVAPVTRPPSQGGDGSGNSGGATGGSDGEVGGVNLPGTGGNGIASAWVAIGGAGLVTAGAGAVVAARRKKGARR